MVLSLFTIRYGFKANFGIMGKFAFIPLCILMYAAWVGTKKIVDETINQIENSNRF